MKLDSGFSATDSTLLAVVLGALLATLGGFVATQLESFFRRRERERNAALLFGELLSTLDLLLKAAADTRAIGDPFGMVTMRVLHAVRREIDIYDRNRESLYDIRDAEIRARIHTVMVRITMPLDGVFDATQELAALPAKGASAETKARIGQVSASRDTSFDFMLEIAERIKPLVLDLRPLARHSFDAHQRAVGD